MPKLKTHKGAQRRFSITGSGKLMRVKGGKSHFRRKKPGRTTGMFDEMVPVHPRDRSRIRRLLPYGV
ncbi:MAG: 50S ribosomal protein L35 [Chloroflexi bacterium]|nr:50S ribosomal protein L35 [Chloroflexota bacterium]